MEKTRDIKELIEIHEELLRARLELLQAVEQSIHEHESKNTNTISKQIWRAINQQRASDAVADYVSVIGSILETIVPRISAPTELIAQTMPIILSIHALIKRIKESDNQPSIGLVKKPNDADSKKVFIVGSSDIVFEELHPILCSHPKYIPNIVERHKDGLLTIALLISDDHENIMNEVKVMHNLTS